jgi:predicted RNA binding protein YcfA (HicA-like mRNA interferase family)
VWRIQDRRDLRYDIPSDITLTMSTAIKLLAAMRLNPNDWTMANLLTVAKRYGMEIRSTGGSHHVFSHPSVKGTLSVPAHRPIKAIYIRRFVALIDQIQE